MDYNQAFAISAAGMTLESTRVNVAAMNLANANTVQMPGAAPYRPMRVVARTLGFEEALDTAASFGSFSGVLRGGLSAPAGALFGALPVATTEAMQAAPRLVHEPGHPAADARGFVAYTAVDTASEMVTMMGAMRSYEANVAAMNTARGMALKALDIGGAG